MKLMNVYLYLYIFQSKVVVMTMIDSRVFMWDINI